MNKKPIIFIILLIVIIIGIFAFVKTYPNSPLIPYSPEGPTYKNDDKNQLGVPVKQMDQGADAGRRATIENLDGALKQYYAKYNKAPTDLNELVTEDLVKSIKTDQITKQPPSYFSEDPQYGCRAELPLSDGSIATAYCK